MSDNLLLRTLTFQSYLRFGPYKDLRVGDLLAMRQHAELIKNYFNLEKINYTEEILEELHLTAERRITKPGKNRDLYYRLIGPIMEEILEEEYSKQETRAQKWARWGLKKAYEKNRKVQFGILEKRWNSKALNKNRNEGKRR